MSRWKLLWLEDTDAETDLINGLSILATGRINGREDAKADTVGFALVKRAASKVTVAGGGILP